MDIVFILGARSCTIPDFIAKSLYYLTDSTSVSLAKRVSTSSVIDTHHAGSYSCPAVFLLITSALITVGMSLATSYVMVE